MAEDKSNCFFVFLKPAVLSGAIPFDKNCIQSPIDSAAGSCVNGFKARDQGVWLSGGINGKDEILNDQTARCRARRRYAHRDTPPVWCLRVVVLFTTTSGGCYGSSSSAL